MSPALHRNPPQTPPQRMIATTTKAVVLALCWCMIGLLTTNAAPRSARIPASAQTLRIGADTPLQIIVPDDADATTFAAGELLQSTIVRAWPDAAIDVVSAANASHSTSRGIDFVLEVAQCAGDTSTPIPLRDPDRFVYSVDQRQRRIALQAYDSEALYLATAHWLDREFGVRWFLPGELGEVLPSHTSIRLRAGKRIIAPAYWSRSFSSSGSTPESREWERRNGLRRTVYFGHNLNRIFTRELLLDKPELAASIDGIPLIPPSQSVSWRYQPDLGSPAVAEVTAEAVRRHFEAKPNSRSFSISINDNTNFGDSPDVLAWVEPIRFFRRRPDYSGLVFSFANRVAEQTADDLDGRYLTSLAYYWAEDVPGFPIHPRIMPILTADRSQYFDPQFRMQDIDLMQRWGQSGVEVFGLWDYYYGAPFVAPRLFFPAMEESIRAAHAAGARSFFAEVIPIWPWDGPKNWIATRLMWDSTASADKLLSEYCRGLYGPASARMEQIFRQWSNAWMSQPGPAEWIKYYRDEDELAIYPDSLWQTTDELLARAMTAVADDSAEYRRIELFARAWDVAKRAKAVYDRRKALRQTTYDAAPILCGHIAAFRTALAELASARSTAAASDPLLANLARTAVTRQSDPSLSILLKFLQQYPQQHRDIIASLSRYGDLTADLITAINVITDPQNKVSFANASFTRGSSIPTTWRYPTRSLPPRIDDWYFFIRPTENAMAALLRQANNTDAFLQFQSTELVQLRQDIPVSPDTSIVATIDIQGHTRPDSRVEWMLEWLNESGNTIATAPTSVDRLPHGYLPHWHTLAITATAPANASRVRIRILAQRLAPIDWIAVANPRLFQAQKE